MVLRNWLSARTDRTNSNRKGARRRKQAVRGRFEGLESRNLLANYTWSDAGNTLAIDLGTNESVQISQAGGVVSFKLNSGTFAADGGDVATGNGTSTIKIAQADLVSSLAIGNLAVAAGRNNVTFAGPGAFTSGDILVNITKPSAVGRIALTGGFELLGTNSLQFTTVENIYVGVDAKISSGGPGGIALRANTQITSTSGTFAGIEVNGGRIQNNGTGELILEARGGTTGSGNHGIFIQNSGMVQATKTGVSANIVTVDGSGGGSTGDNYGVYITGADSRIRSVDGDIFVTGEVGAGGFLGIRVASGAIRTTADGSIILTSDGIQLGGASRVDSTNDTVTLKTKTNDGSKDIDLGRPDRAEGLGLTDAELDRITGEMIIIGDADIANNIRVQENIQHAGDANFRVVTARSIRVWNDQTWTTTEGNLTFIANQGATSSPGTFFGIGVGGHIVSKGRGDINLTGRAGATGSTAGISLIANGSLESKSTHANAGAISVYGTDGDQDSKGTVLQDSFLIASVVGNISVAGKGGYDASSSQHVGVYIEGDASIVSKGLGTTAAEILVSGRGGVGVFANHGIYMNGGSITSIDGIVEMLGVGGKGTDDENCGLLMEGSARIASTGTTSKAATIYIDAEGGGNDIPNSNLNSGIKLATNGTNNGIATVRGEVKIEAHRGVGNSNAIELLPFSRIRSTDSATIELTGDTMEFSGGGISATKSVVRLFQRGLGAISLGTGGGTLDLTDAELDRIAAKALVIGNSSTGLVDVVSPISRTSATNVLLRGSEIRFLAGGFATGGGTLRLNGGNVLPNVAGVDATANSVSLEAGLKVNIAGTTADTDYDQLNIVDELKLQSAPLTLTGSYVPQAGDVFTIVKATSIVGTFDGFAEGSTLNFNGVSLSVHYSTTEVTLSAPDVVII